MCILRPDFPKLRAGVYLLSIVYQRNVLFQKYTDAQESGTRRNFENQSNEVHEMCVAGYAGQAKNESLIYRCNER